MPLVWAMVNEPSIDAVSITLTTSAFAGMDMPAAMLKMMMENLKTIARVTSWSFLWHASLQ